MKAYSIRVPLVSQVALPRRKKEQRDPYDGLRPWSAITHGIGAVLALVGTLALVIPAALAGSWFQMVQFLIYGLSMTGLYTASTLYHCVNTSVRGRIALRKYDHCSIYLLYCRFDSLNNFMFIIVWQLFNNLAQIVLLVFFIYYTYINVENKTAITGLGKLESI